MDRSDGFVNVTKLCCDNGKRLADCLNDEVFKEGFDYMIHEHTGDDGTPPFKTIQQSGLRGRTISGVYYHPIIIPTILGWISPIFRIKMGRIVNNELGFNTMIM